MHATKLIHAHALLSNNYLFMAIQFKQHASIRLHYLSQNGNSLIIRSIGQIDSLVDLKISAPSVFKIAEMF